MDALANHLIDACGGTSAVAKLLKSTTSTVHSWRVNGLPESRLDHLRLASREAGLDIDFAAAVARFADEPQLALPAVHDDDVHSGAGTICRPIGETGKAREVSSLACGAA